MAFDLFLFPLRTDFLDHFDLDILLSDDPNNNQSSIESLALADNRSHPQPAQR
jgi:hypothetical protein